MTESENKICRQLISACFHEEFVGLNSILKEGEMATHTELMNNWYWEQEDEEDVYLIVLSGEKMEVPFPDYAPMGETHKCLKLLSDEEVVLDYAKLEKEYGISVVYSPLTETYGIFWGRKFIKGSLDCPPQLRDCLSAFTTNHMEVKTHRVGGRRLNAFLKAETNIRSKIGN